MCHELERKPIAEVSIGIGSMLYERRGLGGVLYKEYVHESMVYQFHSI